MIGSMSEVTQLFSAMREGDAQATAKLLPLVYDELRRLARAHMTNERSDHPPNKSGYVTSWTLFFTVIATCHLCVNFL